MVFPFYSSAFSNLALVQQYSCTNTFLSKSQNYNKKISWFFKKQFAYVLKSYLDAKKGHAVEKSSVQSKN